MISSKQSKPRISRMANMFLAGFLLIVGMPLLEARPVSYAGGWTVMQKNNWERNRLHVHYSPTVRNSLGATAEIYRHSDREDYGLQWNRLLYRRNTRFSQANLYLKLNGGLARLDPFDEPFLKAEVAGDWETRRWFVAYSAMGKYADALDDGSFHQTARLGVAPYVAGFGSLHTWFMLQAGHHPEETHSEDQLILTPLVRFFKGPYLLELGWSSNDEVLLNWIVRF
ncbi:MAG TPA: hypothetical protein VJ960_08070 [Oceanipulchritudo sp.]|nr:hypothetical protein [Oceanipulchritudo sp.]